MTSEILKKLYINDEKVTYRGNTYRIKDIVYWIDRADKKWKTSPRLVGLNNESIIQVKLEDVEEA